MNGRIRIYGSKYNLANTIAKLKLLTYCDLVTPFRVWDNIVDWRHQAITWKKMIYLAFMPG